jgi:hypothetical protein
MNWHKCIDDLAYLIATIAECSVLGVATWGTQELSQRREWHILTNSSELVSRMMTMSVHLMA